MKVAVTAQNGSLDSQVDPRFGRAAYFVVVDTDTMKFEVVDNKQNLQAASGAGIQAGQTVAESKVEAILTGNCGPKAFATLNAAGIKVYVGLSGTVKDAVEAFKAGKLESTGNANVEAHSGI